MGTILTSTMASISPLDGAAMEAASRRQNDLTKPQGSLGALEDLAIRIAGITGQAMPRIAHKAIITMAADHGVAAEGVSLYPQEVTPQMVLNFLRGGAGINVLARQVGARVVVVDMGVAAALEEHPNLMSRRMGPGTANIARGPAMSREQAIQCLEAGIAIVQGEADKGLDIVGTGDMGIANTTSSAAIAAVITGEGLDKLTGRGTGIDDDQLAHKREVIARALEVNRPDPSDGIDVLSKVGGFEIGGLAGVMLGAAARRIPVVIDGFISGAAALVAVALCPQVKDYLIASHLSAETGHRVVLDHLGLRALHILRMRLGEGTGAALGIFLAEAAVRVLSEMATFAEAGVSQAETPAKSAGA